MKREFSWGGEDKKHVRLLVHGKKRLEPPPREGNSGGQQLRNHLKYWGIFLVAIIGRTATATTHPTTQLEKNKKRFRSQEDKDSAGVCAAVFMGE